VWISLESGIWAKGQHFLSDLQWLIEWLIEERKRKAKRRETAEKCGATFVATLIERFTVRALKFIRWLRNFVYRPTSWEAALARLRHGYTTF
jgi:hypothetical protein